MNHLTITPSLNAGGRRADDGQRCHGGELSWSTISGTWRGLSSSSLLIVVVVVVVAAAAAAVVVVVVAVVLVVVAVAAVVVAIVAAAVVLLLLLLLLLLLSLLMPRERIGDLMGGLGRSPSSLPKPPEQGGEVAEHAKSNVT